MNDDIMFFILLIFMSAFPMSKSSSNKNESDFNSDSQTIQIVGWRWDYVKYPLIICTIVILVSLVKIGYHHLKKVSRLIPESCFLILLGLAIGTIFLIPGIDHREVLSYFSFDSRKFFLYLLPPIILESAYSLKGKAFVDNFGTILLFAVVGTILNIFIIAGVLVGLNYAGVMPALQVTNIGFFVFGALIAAVDPVAVLAIFQDVGVNKAIYYIVFGESLFNDAVTVVMYNLMVEYAEIGSVSLKNAILGVVAFFVEGICSVLIGVTFGLISALITKYTSKVRVTEPILVFGMAYFSYLAAELFHFSGIISIICCGLTQSQYTIENISGKSYISVQFISKVLASVVESLIFIILGVMLLNHAGFWESWNAGFSFISLTVVILTRFLVIFFLTFLVNRFTFGIRTISLNEQLIIAYGGLRGAIAFALVFSLDEVIVHERNSLMCATYVIILFTIFIQGTSMKPLVGCLGIPLQAKKQWYFLQELNHAMLDDILSGFEEIVGRRGKSFWTAAGDHISQKLLRPRFEKVPGYNQGGLAAAVQGISLQSRFFGESIAEPAAETSKDDDDLTWFRARSTLPNAIGDELLEAQDEKRIQMEKELRKRNISTKKKSQLDLPKLRKKFSVALEKPGYKTFHYKVFDKNLKPSGSVTRFQNLTKSKNTLKKLMQKIKPQKWLSDEVTNNVNGRSNVESMHLIDSSAYNYGSI